MGIKNETEITKSFFQSKKIVKFFVTIFIITSIGIAWGYMSLLRSDEYAFAVDYLKNNQKVIETLGPVKSTRPSFTKFKRGYGAGMWTAKFQVVVEGNKHGVAYLHMTNSTNSWVVNEANIVTEDGSTVALTP